ncbi:MAG TPA: tetratricopeptide repeat protein [Armatimonadetes bacterium]|nr:tetratricopeptide repeat protein [Armatimonadota bacterium]
MREVAIFCVKCGAKNPDGAQFCWRCGERIHRRRPEPIPEEEFVTPEEEERQFKKLLDRAFELSERGEVEEAISACEEALKLRPTATTALSLLGSLYERKGEKEKAIECYRKVVLLDPNAAAERGRLLQLGEEVPLPEAPPVRRKVGTALGVSGVVLLLALIVWATIAGYNYAKPSKPRASAPALEAPSFPPPSTAQVRPAPFGGWAGPSGYGPRPTTAAPSRERKAERKKEARKPSPPSKPAPPTTRRKETETKVASSPSFPSPTGWRPYPRYYGGYYARPPSYAPLKTSPEVRAPSPPPLPRVRRPEKEGRKSASPRPVVPARPSVPSQPPQRARIVVESPSPSPEEVAKAEEAEGHRRYLEGDYHSAIAHYRRALGLVKDSLQRAQLLQRLGDAYRDSGDFESARLQYKNAIEEYRKAMKEGAVEEARRGIAACRAALEVIGG